MRNLSIPVHWKGFFVDVTHIKNDRPANQGVQRTQEVTPRQISKFQK